LDATLLLRGLQRLAERNAPLQQTLLHGDCHAGNIYKLKEGPGFTDWQLIQRGNWAQDVAYHIAGVLPSKTAELEERNLLNSYLDSLRLHGGEAPNREQAWDDYRCAQIYGYYHWAITSKVDPEITKTAFQRLGAGVTRHDSYKLLGL
jgi:aminoglycoside phosphotransferase (APT) family kinase protein